MRQAMQCWPSWVTRLCDMGLLPDMCNCRLPMRWGCQERFPHHRFQRKPLVNDPCMHHSTCVTHVPWYMSRSLTRSGGENVSGIPGARATRNFRHVTRGSLGEISCELQIIYRNQLYQLSRGPTSITRRKVISNMPSTWIKHSNVHVVFTTSWLLSEATSSYPQRVPLPQHTHGHWNLT